MKTKTLVLMFFAFSLSFRAGGVSAQSSGDAVGEGLGFKGIAAGGGFVNPENQSNTFGYLGQLDLGTILPDLRLLPTVEYWSKTNKAFLTKVSSSDLTTGADVRYTFAGSGIRPYVGAGASADFIRSKVEVGGRKTDSDTRVRPGAAVLGGITVPQKSWIEWFGEAKYRFVSDVSSFRLFGGFRIWFGAHPSAR